MQNLKIPESFLVYSISLYAVVMLFIKNCQPLKKYFEFQGSITQSLTWLDKGVKVDC